MCLDTCTDSSCLVFVIGGPFGLRVGTRVPNVVSIRRNGILCQRPMRKIPFGGRVPKLAVCCKWKAIRRVAGLLFIILRKQRSGVWRGRPQTSAEGTGHGGGPGSGYKSRPEQEWPWMPSIGWSCRHETRGGTRYAGWPASMAINIPQMPFLSFWEDEKMEI